MARSEKKKEKIPPNDSSLVFFTPYGDIEVRGNREEVTGVSFLESIMVAPPQSFRTLPLGKEVLRQLEGYFLGRRRTFSLPLADRGTDFQKELWAYLVAIPFGETRTYGQAAKDLGRSQAARAVGMGAHVNPFSILVPCHRLLGSGGQLVGFAGGLPWKMALLSLERGRLRRP